ncbi:hypothetical protein Tcan_10957 [Toxocara canis]|uniref:G_PROTEIN_RECEP_F1_2 domain-containing protein n=1 Tax=Toxocara canis TaxID=6265 RepID=A0A0B2V6Y2_TOXCA|nr:hypothetical protein Tcan_10957 [Toxocara canis]
MYFFIGCINFFLITSSVIPYTLVLLLIFRDQYSLDSFRIMLHLGISDITQLTMQYHSAFSYFFHGQHSNPILNKICGAVLNAGWTSYVALTLLLSLNRLVTVIQLKPIGWLFTGRTLHVLLIACWIWGSVFLIGYLSPALNLIYVPSLLTWSYTGDQPLESVVRQIAVISATIQISLTAVVYLAIFIFLWCRRLFIHFPHVQPAASQV